VSLGGVCLGTRIEVDSLGERQIPEDVYYGIQTLRAVENFPVSGLRAPPVFVYAYVLLKKACALANMEVGWLDDDVGGAIVRACDEVLSGRFLDQFVVDVFQAGAGTSFNMNVNEVLANRALELLGGKKGDYSLVSPNDHVNLGQSTNDTFPSALHVAVLLGLERLDGALRGLVSGFAGLAGKFGGVLKSGRTHLQDALPVTVGSEFGAYAAALESARLQLLLRRERLLDVALGGTAVGSGVGCHEDFAALAVGELGRLSGFSLRVAPDLFEALQSRGGVACVSGGLRDLALELVRIANDLRLLSSGPSAGLGEISLPAVQPGSSIMPGKVNPVMAECLDMVGFQVVGNDLVVSLAVQAGQLELNVMMPVMMRNLLESIELLANFLPIFTCKCVEGVEVDENRCGVYVEKNPSLAVFLSPYVGYLQAAKVAKRAWEENRSVEEVALEEGVLGVDQAKEIFERNFLLGRRGRRRRKVDG
jgi:aspartate ammonia-lyase